MWRREDELIKDHFKTLADELRAMLSQGSAAISGKIQNAALHQFLPRDELFYRVHPTNEAFAQTLPLLDPMIEATEVLIERFAGRD